MKYSKSVIASIQLVVVVAVGCFSLQSVADNERLDVSHERDLILLLDLDPVVQLTALKSLEANWHNNLTPAILEYISLNRSPKLQKRAFQVLSVGTNHDFGYDLNAWFGWAWKLKEPAPRGYARFKSKLYARLDPKFAGYFSAQRKHEIRLDEIRWGGVVQDGIPPLREPKMIPAALANYLDDYNIVFGLEINGDFRAYPKRILAWHEMFVDTVGDVSVVGVYCTLCGSMILYESVIDGVNYEMGTSGFLYRSNKLMYDKATQSLWNTMWGKPAVGPLVNRGIRLPRRTIVTTTWAEWRRRHPTTTVLSLSTGYKRDYGEGVAYKDYFSTDELMFNSSQIDTRLANKAEILGLLSADGNHPPLAIAAQYAEYHPLLHEQIGDTKIVVLSDQSGAMRVYATEGLEFVKWDRDRTLYDADGKKWLLEENQLVGENNGSLPRLPSHNAFWFGWYGAYTNTRLIH